MNLLNDDMSAAIDTAKIAENDKETLKAILYQERQNKERTWDSDAEKYIMKLIDEGTSEAATE